MLVKYFKWLPTASESSSYNVDEIGLVLLSHEFHAESGAKNSIAINLNNCVELFKGLEERERIIQYLLFQGISLEAFFPFYTKRDIGLFFEYKEDLDSVFKMINGNNFAHILKSLKRTFISENTFDTVKACIGFVDFDPSFFTEFVDEKCVLRLFRSVEDAISCRNLVSMANSVGVSLINEIISYKRFNEVYLVYLTPLDKIYLLEDVRMIFKAVQSHEGNAVVTCSFWRLLENSASREFMNEAIKWYIEHGLHPNEIYKIIENRIELINSEIIDMFVYRNKWI
jgi:hypothetical protein